MKNFLIIGGSSGIGNQLGHQLAIDSQVFATYNLNPLESKQNISYHHLNVLDENSELDFLPEVLDGLVYCPGSISLKPFARMSAADYRNDYELNVIGAVRCIQKCLPNLKKSSSASIILFSTVAVQTGMNFHSLVSSSKGAIEGLTRALAAEFAPTIRVNCIAPSLTDTPLANNLLNNEEKIIASGKRHPMQRIGKAEDIANMASFLLSEKNNWITGQIFHIDGGMGNIK